MRYPGEILEVEIEIDIEIDAEECLALFAQAPQLLSVVLQSIAQSHPGLLLPSPAKELPNGKATLPLGLILDAARSAQKQQ